MRLRFYVDRRQVAVLQDRKEVLLKQLETANEPPPPEHIGGLIQRRRILPRRSLPCPFPYLVCFT